MKFEIAGAMLALALMFGTALAQTIVMEPCECAVLPSIRYPNLAW
jgi:hypothetical protein